MSAQTKTAKPLATPLKQQNPFLRENARNQDQPMKEEDLVKYRREKRQYKKDINSSYHLPF